MMEFKNNFKIDPDKNKVNKKEETLIKKEMKR